MVYVLFIGNFIVFLLVHKKDPGRMKNIDMIKMAFILDRALKEDRNINYFCFYCRTLRSYSSVHCATCGVCVDAYDHHCYVVNNCMGHKNIKWFYLFIGSTFTYTCVQMGLALSILVQVIMNCQKT